MKSLCYWLDAKQLQAVVEKLAKIANNPPEISSTFVNTSELLNHDADTFMPVNPDTGWRSSDIDLLQSPSTDPRVINSLAGRFIRQPEPSNEGVSDEQLEQSVIPRNFTPFDAVSAAGAIRQSFDDLHDSPPESLSPPIVEPPKTE